MDCLLTCTLCGLGEKRNVMATTYLHCKEFGGNITGIIDSDSFLR